MSGITIIHSSDIHVDDGYTARAHGGDGTRGLRCVLETARAATADLVLLAGDVFEHNRLPDDLLQRAASALRDCRIPIVLLPGNHDPLTPDSSYFRGGISEPENVHVLGHTHDDAVLFADLDIEVWGIAHRDYGDMEPLGHARARSTRWQIAMGHGHYEGEIETGAAHRPSWIFSDAEIARTGVDYLALGHWNRHIQVGNGAVPAFYSGSPDLENTVNRIHFREDGTIEVLREDIIWD